MISPRMKKLIPSTMIPPRMKNISLPVPSCFRDRIVGNVKKKHAVPSVDKLQLKQKKLHVLRDIQYGPLFLIVLYLILKTISLEQLTTERQGYKFRTVYTCITFHFLH
jgi:hypothetical protein